MHNQPGTPTRYQCNLLCALLLCLLAPFLKAAPVEGSIVIIANRSVRADSIPASEFRDVFLGDAGSVGGSKVSPAVLKRGSAHEAFLKLLGRSESAFEATWRKQVFTGRGMMPRSFDREEDLISYVRKTPGAIGYSSAEPIAPGLKILKLR